MRNATFTKQNYGTLQAGQKNQNIFSPVVKVQRERERERERENKGNMDKFEFLVRYLHNNNFTPKNSTHLQIHQQSQSSKLFPVHSDPVSNVK